MGEHDCIAVALKDGAVQYRDGLLCLHFSAGEHRLDEISLCQHEGSQARVHQ